MSIQNLHIAVITVALSFIPGLSGNAVAAMPVDEAMALYQQQGAGAANPAHGEELWKQSFLNNKTNQKRSCTSCHTDNLRAMGSHIRTKKAIEPLAPSANKERLTEIKKINKWFKRNCKWTLGRECSAQEKMDFLSYIRTQ